MHLTACFFAAALLLVSATATAYAETDHLAAVIVKDLDKVQPPGVYTVETGHGQVNCELKKAKFLLLPARKNGGDDPRGSDPGELVCYTAKCSDPTEGASEIDDQFGTHTLERKKIKLVCAPADPIACGNDVVDAGETCDGADDDACPGLCAGDCTCPAPSCGNNVVEGSEECDGTDDGDCPGECQVDCTCSTPEPKVCCTLPMGCSGGVSPSLCTSQPGTPGTATDYCGDSGECGSTFAGPGGCCQYTTPVVECQLQITELDCETNGGTYISGNTCTGSGACIEPKFVFVTSTTHSANLGGLSGADAICQQRALMGGLPGTYRAWLSSTITSAAARLTHSTTPYILRDGNVIADNWDDLTDGTIDIPINVNENAVAVPSASVWTATTAAGAFAGSGTSCSDWTSTVVGNVEIGFTDDIDSGWTLNGVGSCISSNRLYCVQQ